MKTQVVKPGFFLSHRPQLTSPHQMQMHVKDSLSRLRASVGDEPIPVREILFRRELFRDDKHAPHDVGVRRFERVDGVNVAVGDNEDMSRRGGMQVTKGRHPFVAVDNGRGRGAVHDLAEDTVAHVVVDPEDGMSQPVKERRQEWDQVLAHKRYHSIPFPRPCSARRRRRLRCP